jgi:hypothetical protein
VGSFRSSALAFGDSKVLGWEESIPLTEPDSALRAPQVSAGALCRNRVSDNSGGLVGFGPIGFVLVVLWALPIVVILWFIFVLREIRDRLRSMDRRLADLEQRVA